MWQGDGGVATPSADIRGKPELMSAMGSIPKKLTAIIPGCDLASPTQKLQARLYAMPSFRNWAPSPRCVIPQVGYIEGQNATIDYRWPRLHHVGVKAVAAHFVCRVLCAQWAGDTPV
jgi:hypothetical protein